MNIAPTLKARLAEFEQAITTDAKQNAGPGTSHYAVISARPLPSDQAQVIVSQPALVKMAFQEFPPSNRYDKAKGRLKQIFAQEKATLEKIYGIQQHLVCNRYVLNVRDRSERLVKDEALTTADFEDESGLSKRWQAESDALHDTLRRLALAEIGPAAVMRDEILAALSSLAAKLEKADADQCARFGCQLEFSTATRLCQGCAIQAFRLTHDIARFEKLPATAVFSPFSKSLFENLTSW